MATSLTIRAPLSGAWRPAYRTFTVPCPAGACDQKSPRSRHRWRISSSLPRWWWSFQTRRPSDTLRGKGGCRVTAPAGVPPSTGTPVSVVACSSPSTEGLITAPQMGLTNHGMELRDTLERGCTHAAMHDHARQSTLNDRTAVCVSGKETQHTVIEPDQSPRQATSTDET